MSRAFQIERLDEPAAVRGSVRPQLSRSATRAMRHFLHAHREGWSLDSRLRDVARVVADDAKHQCLAPEQMLVALKDSWNALEEARQLPLHEMRTFQDRLVSCSIRAYYGRLPRYRDSRS